MKLVPLTTLAQLNPRQFTAPATNEDPVSFVPMKAVEEETGRLDPTESRPWGQARKGYTPFQEGDVVFAKITPCMENGKYAVAKGLVGGRAVGSTELFVIRPGASLDAKYLLHFLFSAEVRRAAKANMRGAAGQLRVPLSFFQNLAVPFVDLETQRLVVKEIDRHVSCLRTGVAALERVRANLKRYRAAVLKAACEGTLVPTEAELAHAEGRDYESGGQLVERILTDRRESWTGKGNYKTPAPPKSADCGKIPPGWAWASLVQLTEANRACAYGVLQPGKDRDDGIALVRVGDVNNGKVDTTELKRISPTIAARYPRTTLRGGELLISLVGAIGRTAIAPKSLAGANTARAIGVIPLVTTIDAAFVEIWFRNPAKIAAMTSQAHEVARKTLNLEDVRVATVAVPPLAEQHRIVAEVERQLSVIDELETLVETNLARAGRLRQSILIKAFSGELVPEEAC